MNAHQAGKATEMFLRESNAIEGVYDDVSLSQAKVAWEYLIAKDELTVPVILHTHKILMLHSALQPDQKGYIRKISVYIGGREAMSPPYIRIALNKWLKRVKSDLPEEPKEMHVDFEAIHPFVDGNGRIGRMLMNWQRVKRGYPLLIIKASERQAYYQWFK